MKKVISLNIVMVIVPLTVISQTQLKKQTSSVVTTDGVSITYDVYGTGTPALVFVHGWSTDRSYWKEQIQAFLPTYKVVTIDLGGHGESSFGRKDWTINSFGNDVSTVVRELKLNQVILIGHSMGGDVVIDAALQLPGQTVGLIMVDTYNKLGVGRTPVQVEDFVNKFRTNFSDSVQHFVRNMFRSNSDNLLLEQISTDMASAPPEVALSSLKSSFTHSRQITHDLEHLTLPIIAINPDNVPTDFESMQQHGVEVFIIPGGSHFSMLEDPKTFNETLDAAIKQILHK